MSFSLESNNDAENVEHFDLNPIKYIGIQKIKKLEIQLFDNFILPYPCGINSIAFLNLKDDTTQYLTLNGNLNQLFTFSKINLVVIEKLNESLITEIGFIKDYELNNSFELGISLNLIDITISDDCDRFALITKSLYYNLSVWDSNDSFKIADVDPESFNHDVMSDIKVNKCTFYPNDNKKIIILGNKIFICFSLKNEQLIPTWNYTTAEFYLSYSWINHNQIIVGNNLGNVLIFSENLINQKINVATELIKQDDKMQSRPLKMEINHILKISNGFICTLGSKKMAVYMKTTLNDFKFHHSFELKTTSNENLGTNSDEFLTNVTINQDETFLILVTNLNRIYKIVLTKEMMFNYDDMSLNPVKNFFSSKILSVDLSIQKSLVATCAQEKCVKIFNFETGDLELNQTFEDSSTSVTIHPSGLYLAVSFLSRIDYCTILYDQLMCNKSFKCQTPCNDCQFSKGGHFIGLISTNSINIYNLWTYEHINELKFRNGKLTHFEWFNEDQHIAASSNLGIICIWNIYTAEKLIEYSEKTVQFTRLAVDIVDNNLIIFASDHLNNLRLLNAKLKSGNILEVDNINLIFEKYINNPNSRKTANANTSLNQIIITSFCFHQNLVIFGTEKGHIIIQNYLTDEKQVKIFHKSSICQLKIITTLSKTQLISCSEDGLIIISDLISSLCNALSLLDQLHYSDDILQTKLEIKKKHNYDLNLQFNLIEKNEEQAYQLRLKELEHKEQTKTINYESKLELTRLRTLLKELKFNDEKKIAYNTRRIESLKLKFEKDLDFVREAAENDLSKEFEKHQNLIAKYETSLALNESLDEQLKELSQPDHLNKINKEVEVYKQYKLYDFKQEAKSDLINMNRKVNILKKENDNLEQEGDKLIMDTKLNNETIINEANKANDLIRIDISLVKKQLNETLKEIKKVKSDELNYEENLLCVKKKYLTKLNYIENLKKILNSTSAELLSKEKRIQLLKIKLDQLKKYKFINEYRIKELRSNLEPLLTENNELKQTMQINQKQLETNISTRINHLKMTKDSMFNLKKQIDKKICAAKSKLSFASSFNFKMTNMLSDLESLTPKPELLLDLYNKFKTSIEKSTFE